MLERKVALCPEIKKKDNAERIRKLILNDMENGNYLRGLAMNFTRRFVLNFHEREDIYADFLLRMSGRAPETYKYIIDGSEPVAKNEEFIRWVVGCFSNLAVDYLRRKNRKKEFSLTSLGYDGWKGIEAVSLSNYPFCDYSPEQKIIEKEETGRLLTKIIPNLSEKEQRIINMIYFKGMEYREIAKELDIPLGTVKSCLHSTKKMLKREIKN